MSLLALLLMPILPVPADPAPPVIPTVDGTPLEVNASYDALAHYRNLSGVLGGYHEGREL